MAELKETARVIYSAEQHCSSLGEDWEAVRSLLLICHSTRMTFNRELLMELTLSQYSCHHAHFKE
eukprot:2373111-Karenia_brevis.AAC.1